MSFNNDIVLNSAFQNMQIEELRKFSGSIEEFNELTTNWRKEWLQHNRAIMLLTPSHHRVRKFGKDLLELCGVNYTERRVLA